ncbi:hypothetical protein C3Y90_23740 [Rhizobium sp. UPM1134]|nr:hypothetical protein [Rhizobium ruizarguesonis]
MPLGWFDLVHDLRLDLMRDYPSVTVTEMTSDRGWLHVRVDNSGLDPAARLRLDRMLQGYVTQSLTTCMSCGSARGSDRGERREITCDACEKECCDVNG